MQIEQGVAGSPYPPSSNLYYRVSRGQTNLVDWSPLGITLSGGVEGSFVSNLVFLGESELAIDEEYETLSGKRLVHVNRCTSKVLRFCNVHGAQIALEFRAFDDGVAFRYGFTGTGAVSCASESSGFRVPEDAVGWMQKYRANYEGFYEETPLETAANAAGFAFPALFRLPAGNWLLLTEAGVYRQYGGCRIAGTELNQRICRIMFASSSAFTATRPCATPWRVIILGDSPAEIFESGLPDHLGYDHGMPDVSWIAPGRCAWSWLQDPASPVDFERQKEHVDFAADLGWEYILVDAGWNAEWVPELVAYAAAREVAVLLWALWTDLDTDAERQELFSIWASWGVKGVKVDFMDSDSQDRMRFYADIADAAAQHRLMLLFHGSTLPRGQRRSWPHVMGWEAVRAEEWYTLSNTGKPTPAHNCTLPFTRNVVGSMDYTPVMFSQSTWPRETTHAHELALSVVFECAWQCFADSPESYRNVPGALPFLRRVPTVWDASRLVEGEPGRFACVRRKSGADWYLGAINATTGRVFEIDLSFLDQGQYVLELYEDGPGGSNIARSIWSVTNGDVLAVGVLTNGGFAASLSAAAPFDRWRGEHFGEGELGNPSISGAMADPDGDGLPNIVEYAFNVDPWHPGEAGAGLSSVAYAQEGTQSHLYFDYARRLPPREIAYRLDASEDLGQWEIDASRIQELGSTDNGDGVTETVHCRIPIAPEATASDFVRISVVSP